jgi:hypothetical protein
LLALSKLIVNRCANKLAALFVEVVQHDERGFLRSFAKWFLPRFAEIHCIETWRETECGDGRGGICVSRGMTRLNLHQNTDYIREPLMKILVGGAKDVVIGEIIDIPGLV